MSMQFFELAPFPLTSDLILMPRGIHPNTLANLKPYDSTRGRMAGLLSAASRNLISNLNQRESDPTSPELAQVAEQLRIVRVQIAKARESGTLDRLTRAQERLLREKRRLMGEPGKARRKVEPTIEVKPILRKTTQDAS